LKFFSTLLSTNTILNCDVHAIQFQPSIALTSQQVFDMWADIENGTAYATNDAFCITTGGTVIDLGVTAETDMEALLSSDWFAISIKQNAEPDPITAADDWFLMFNEGEFLPKNHPILQVTYETGHQFPIPQPSESLAIQDEGITSTFARTETISAFSGIIGSRDAPFNVFDDVAPFEVCDNTEQPSGTGSQLSFGWFKTSASADCFLAIILWDIDTVPNNAAIQNVSMQLKGLSSPEGIQLQNNQCEFNHIATFPALLGSDAKGNDARDGENFLTDPNCSTKLGILIQGGAAVETPEPAVIFDLGNATGELQDRLGKGSSTSCSACTGFDWFAVGLDFDQGSKNGTNDEIQRVRGDVGNTAKLIVRFSSPTDQITDLTAVGRYLDVDLDWTAPPNIRLQ